MNTYDRQLVTAVREGDLNLFCLCINRGANKSAAVELSIAKGDVEMLEYVFKFDDAVLENQLKSKSYDVAFRGQLSIIEFICTQCDCLDWVAMGAALGGHLQILEHVGFRQDMQMFDTVPEFFSIKANYRMSHEQRRKTRNYGIKTNFWNPIMYIAATDNRLDIFRYAYSRGADNITQCREEANDRESKEVLS